MRLCALFAAAMMMTGCATGSPMGFRVASASLRHRPATPASMPREVPDLGAPAPRPAVASTSASPQGAKARATAKPTPAPVAKKKTPATPARRPDAPRPAPGDRDDVLATARALMGQTQLTVKGRRFQTDCIGLVLAAYSQAGITFRGAGTAGDNGVTAMYRYVQEHGRVYTRGRPQPGDIVFFRETYDQNRDGRRNDGLTHVGLVDAVDESGTVTVIHRVNRGVVRYRMNLARKDVQRDPKTGQVLNDMLRPPGPGQKQVLTGQLFAAYASLLPSTAPATAVARR
ncbi:CHAP domain-containing protein [Myxococcaceae bacterium GXIMD 01537]